jgi:hypothetical protein
MFGLKNIYFLLYDFYFSVNRESVRAPVQINRMFGSKKLFFIIRLLFSVKREGDRTPASVYISSAPEHVPFPQI